MNGVTGTVAILLCPLRTSKFDRYAIDRLSVFELIDNPQQACNRYEAKRQIVDVGLVMTFGRMLDTLGALISAC